MFLSILNSMYYHIVLICMLLKSYWNCVSFGGSFAQLWLVMAKLWPFEGWLSFRSWFQDNDVFFAHCEVSSHPVIMVCILLGSSWKNASFGDSFSSFELVWQRYDNNRWCANYTLVILLQSGNISGLLIPSSNSHYFMR